MNDRLQRMAEYFESRNPDRAAEAWAELKEHRKAAELYAAAGDQHWLDKNYGKASASYLKAALQFSQARATDQAQSMRQNAKDCQAHMREEEKIDVMRDQADATRTSGQTQAEAILQGARLSASQSRENFAALAEALREGFVGTARALIGGFTALAQAQREAAIAGAEIVFRGLERIAVSQTEGYAQLATAIREGDLVHALSTYAGLRGIGRQEAGAAEAFKNVIADRINSLNPAQQESARLNAFKLFDALTKMIQDERLPVPGPMPESMARRIVDGEVPRIKVALEAPWEGAKPARISPVPPELEYTDCIRYHDPTPDNPQRRPGPERCVVTWNEDGRIRRQCMVAYAAQNPGDQGFARLKFQIFHAELLRQGDCPRPLSRSITRRIPGISWLFFKPEICPLADGKEHIIPRVRWQM